MRWRGRLQLWGVKRTQVGLGLGLVLVLVLVLMRACCRYGGLGWRRRWDGGWSRVVGRGRVGAVPEHCDARIGGEHGRR